MFRAGDEFLRTQHGKTNPYDVDGPLTWIDWSRRDLHRDIFRFFLKMIQFRKDHPSIGRSMFWRDDVSWYGLTGAPSISHPRLTPLRIAYEAHRMKTTIYT